MSAFVGREHELDLLKRRLDDARVHGRGSLIALRGRRRVGKSRLVEEFARRAGTPYVFYTAVQEASDHELNRFARAVATSDAPSGSVVRAGAVPTTWEGALELALQGATRARPLILVIDELPYLIEKEPSVEAVLQKVWDRTAQAAPVVIVLIGSDQAMMGALSEQGRPLYDRARDVVIEPLNVADIGRLLEIPADAAYEAYAVIGGFPVLAQEWGPGRSRAEYLADALTDPTSFLVISAERALAAEFPPDSNARSVLTAIGHDVRAYSRLESTVGQSAPTLSASLETLQEKRIVQRVTPYSTVPVRSPHYVLTDPYMRFWLRFVNQRIDWIERGRGELLVDDVATSWSSYLGPAVEPMLRASLERLLPDPSRFGAAQHVGSFWNRQGTVEVDIVAGDRVTAPHGIDLLGSIKWRDSASFDSHDARALAHARTVVPGAEASRLLGITNTTFDDDGLLDVRLGPDELLAAWLP
jgi:AAA+ ATPase superfamily predicted ATPase